MYLIGHDGFFDREGIYAERGKPFYDNVMRYIFFGRAAAASPRTIFIPTCSMRMTGTPPRRPS